MDFTTDTALICATILFSAAALLSAIARLKARVEATIISTESRHNDSFLNQSFKLRALLADLHNAPQNHKVELDGHMNFAASRESPSLTAQSQKESTAFNIERFGEASPTLDEMLNALGAEVQDDKLVIPMTAPVRETQSGLEVGVKHRYCRFETHEWKPLRKVVEYED